MTVAGQRTAVPGKRTAVPGARTTAPAGGLTPPGDIARDAGSGHTPARFEWPVRVYWEDTDGGGIVYHSNYLAFMERARSEWLRALGVDQGALREKERVQFAVVEMQVKWKRAARYDDLLVATAEVVERGGASLQFAQSVRRGGEVLVEALVRVAAVDAHTMRPRRMPAAIVALFGAGDDRNDNVSEKRNA